MKIGENRLNYGSCKGRKIDGSGFMIYIHEGIFDGEWSEGMRQSGIMQYIDGSVFDGGWEQDKRHGEGIFKNNNGQIIYGKWKDHELIEESNIDNIKINGWK